MKKILFLFENFKVGGSEIALIKIANNLLHKYDITFLVLQDIGNAKIFLDPKIKIINVNNGNKGIKFGFIKVLKQIYFSNPEFIITSKPHLSVIYIFLFVKFKLIYREASNPDKSMLLNFNQRILNIFFDIVGYINKLICFRYIHLSNSIYSNSNCNFFNSPCIIPNFIEEPISLSDNLDVNKSDYLKILSIGRISDQKNYLPVLKSLKELKINNIKFEYKICYGSISDLVLFNNIKKYISVNNLTQEVILIPFLKDPYELLVDSNVFLSPSTFEGMSTTLYTSLLFNKVNIASEYFREELGAYDVTFFNTNSYLDLYDKLFLVSKKIANNSIKSYNNSELVKQKYSKNNIISKWELILQ